MLNFYKIVKENLSFNRFQYDQTVCLEYSCPIDAEEVAIFSQSDYIVHVLSGKKTYKTFHGEYTLSAGQTLYLKKGAEIIHQYFDDEYCMLGFFLSDDLIRETLQEIQGKVPLKTKKVFSSFTAAEVYTNQYLEGYFQSMLMYFRGQNRPPDHIMLLKLKELLINVISSDPGLTGYFGEFLNTNGPSLSSIMEANYCFNLKLEDFAELTHRSLSSFKRDFQNYYNESPGKWLQKKRVAHAANLLANSDLNVSQIAFESGFENLSHFSRSFKNITGKSPTKYKSS